MLACAVRNVYVMMYTHCMHTLYTLLLFIQVVPRLRKFNGDMKLLNEVSKTTAAAVT
jgi:hypothetical protein